MSLDTLPQPGRLHRPHTIEDATLRTKTIHLTLAALLGLSGALPTAATEYQASDYLPLAVGNSWTYDHHFYDRKDNEGERRFGDYDQWPAKRYRVIARYQRIGLRGLPLQESEHAVAVCPVTPHSVRQ